MNRIANPVSHEASVAISPSASTTNATSGSRMFTAAMLLVLTLAAVLVHGYHVGIEDQGIYLPAIKQHLQPALYPHDSEMFLPQTRPTLFDEAVAYSSRFMHLSVETTMLLWQLASIYLVLWGCLRVARRCFVTTEAQWASVAMVAALLTIGVAGTGLYLVDEYLHPRAPTTVLLLLMLVDVLDRKLWRAPLWVALAALFHIQMTFYGVLLAVFLLFPENWLPPKMRSTHSGIVGALLGLPLFTLFQKGSDAWLEAARTRSIHYLLRWEWYEWLGIFGPMVLLWWYARIGHRHNLARLAFLARRLMLFAIFIFIAGCIITIPPALERLTPYQPMRGLHLVYLLFVLLSGGLLGQFVLRRSVVRWVALLVPLSLAMFYAQRQLYSASNHIELPGEAPRNPWLQAYDWVRQSTPVGAYFAIDPDYMNAPEVDQHGFRALAERSVMADYIKDSGVVLLFPAIADRWRNEVRARKNWKDFRRPDFEKLHRDFGVDWVLLSASQPGAGGLVCPYANQAVQVCRVE
ncbi:MAG TPA: hypothetical protein VFA71_02565 [Terriglobales bacterium]|nr:hypothetical protein [Terriglobales bacterium]